MTINFESKRIGNACVTSYNIDTIESIDWRDVINNSRLSYIVAGLEVCPDTGKLHYQMYMEFDEKVTVRQIKNMLRDKSAHVEQRYGSAAEAIEYCKKEGKWFEHGRRKNPGERTDLQDVYASLKVGRSLLDIIEEHPGTYIRYFKGIERVQDIFRRKMQKLEERVQPTVIVYIGRSGTGKSHHCYHDPDYQASGYKFPVQQSGKVYFDGYDGESTIWFDEFGGSVLPFGVFLRLCDKWETRVETKGATVCITNLRKILISTTTDPKYWWRDSRKYQEDPRQLWRRLTHVYYIPYIMLEYAEPVEIADPENFGDEMAEQLDRRAEEERSQRSRDAEVAGAEGDRSSDQEPIDLVGSDESDSSDTGLN